MSIWVRTSKSGRIRAAGGVSFKPPKDIENWVEYVPAVKQKVIAGGRSKAEVLICDCMYHEPPCPYCETDAIVLVQGRLMRRSEAMKEKR